MAKDQVIARLPQIDQRLAEWKHEVDGLDPRAAAGTCLCGGFHGPALRRTEEIDDLMISALQTLNAQIIQGGNRFAAELADHRDQIRANTEAVLS